MFVRFLLYVLHPGGGWGDDGGGKFLVLGELTFSWGEKRLKNNINQKLDDVSAKRKNIAG